MCRYTLLISLNLNIISYNYLFEIQILVLINLKFNLLVVVDQVKEGLKYFTAMHGELFVTVSGTSMMLKLCAER